MKSGSYDGTNKTIGSDGKTLAEESPMTGTVIFAGLEQGTYVLKETSAPTIYWYDESVTYYDKYDDEIHFTTDNYKANTAEYVVSVKVVKDEDDTSKEEVTVTGLTTKDETTGNPVFYNSRVADKKITVKKIWDDGITNHTPDELAVTITTKVPTEMTDSYKLIFDANGGKFDNDSVTNKLVYDNGRNHVVGTYLEPIFVTKFLGWNTATDGSGTTYTGNDVSAFKPALTNIGETGNTLYANWSLQYQYAVQLYGIGHDTLEDGSTGGLTFGPALGADYTYSKDYGYAIVQKSRDTRIYPTDDHLYDGDENTYVYGWYHDKPNIYEYIKDDGSGKWTDEWGTYHIASDSFRYMRVSSGHRTDTDGRITGKDMGLTDAHILADGTKIPGGNAYRCIHHDDWNTIIDWNEKDPYVYEKCISNNCVATVTITPNSGNSVVGAGDKVFHTDSESMKLICSGNGVGTLLNELCGPITQSKESASYTKYGLSLTYNDAQNLTWANSNIRAMLNGYTKDDYEDAGYVTDFTETYYSSTNSLLSAFPEELQRAIGAKAVKYTKHYLLCGHYATLAEPDIANDKLWLFANNEIYNDSVVSRDYSNYSTEGTRYEKFKDLHSDSDNYSLSCFYKNFSLVFNHAFWLRSRYGGSNGIYCSQLNFSLFREVSRSDGGVSPGFVLAR